MLKPVEACPQLEHSPEGEDPDKRSNDEWEYCECHQESAGDEEQRAYQGKRGEHTKPCEHLDQKSGFFLHPDQGKHPLKKSSRVDRDPRQDYGRNEPEVEQQVDQREGGEVHLEEERQHEGNAAEGHIDETEKRSECCRGVR